MPKHIAIVGGGIAGLAAAYEFTRQQEAGADLTFTLFESSTRLGGIVDTARADGFLLEGGPDGWVTEKPWARDLAIELGLADELLPSNDADRVTYILRNGTLRPMPDGMRMMVPTNLDALDGSPLFSDEARRRYREEPSRAAELKAAAPQHDETVASFVERHFGTEVLNVIGAPLLNGVFGGDVHQLSVQAVMQPFVQMERTHGSLILALQQRAKERGPRAPQPIFTTLRTGVATLTDALAARIPATAIQRNQTVTAIARSGNGWRLTVVPTSSTHADKSDVPAPPQSTVQSDTLQNNTTQPAARVHFASQSGETAGLNFASQSQSTTAAQIFDALLLATPVHITRRLLAPLAPELAPLLDIPGSSAVTVAFGFAANTPIATPRGFGFLAPPEEGSHLLAATFAHQKFANRAPAGAANLRAYFGGATADRLLQEPDSAIRNLALRELATILGPLPTPIAASIRRWPLALPQYHVGHLERMAELDRGIATLGNLTLLGNGYRGVGLPDLVRDARAAAVSIASAKS